MPELYGSVTPSAAAAATAASTAVPPFLRTLSPIRVASGSTVATAPPRPMLVGTFGGAFSLAAWAAGDAAGVAAGRASAAPTSGVRRAGPVVPTVTVSA